ncbi:MAG: hypothetical protein ABF292_05190, partial [Desulfobacterales bacterium]
MENEFSEKKNSQTKGKSYSDRTPAAVALDNMMRRALRVSDPYNFHEVAEALGKRYPMAQREMRYEAEGVPFYKIHEIDPKSLDATSSSAEMDQAQKDVDRDLNALIGNALLKDIQPELMGWATAIRSSITEGVNAARFALDPRQRDKTFSVRRLLSEYARVSRFVGAMTPTLNLPYRRLAQSLDETANVLMVMMGEALANIGFSGGRFLLQAPLSELQARRDTVMNALRNLIGTTQASFGSSEWPRGLRAYRQFLDRLSGNAHHDIRSLFQENELARVMDELIDRAAGTTADGLRALGATAQISLERFRRLIALGQGVVQPASPPFTAFLEALRLFLEAFNNSPSGYRLLAIARPAIVFYGLYGMSGPDDATRRLQSIVTNRGTLAEALDCYLGCNCCSDQVRCQILLDKALYDVDRAIDLYSLGMVDFGEPEQRAAAYGFILNEFVDLDGLGQDCIDVPCSGGKEVVATNTTGRIHTTLTNIIGELWEPRAGFTFTQKQLDTMRDELCIQLEAEKQWYSLLQTMAPNCTKANGLIMVNDQNFLQPTFELINTAMLKIDGLGAAHHPCVSEDEFPEEISVAVSKIESNTEPIRESRGMIMIEPNPVDFGPLAYDYDQLNPPVQNVVVLNYGQSTLSDVELGIQDDSPFTISQVVSNGIDYTTHIADDGQLCIVDVLAPNEKLFVALKFKPDVEPNDDRVIETKVITGLLTVFACSYTASQLAQRQKGKPFESVTASTGAAKLIGTLLGDDQPGEGEMHMYTQNGKKVTDTVVASIYTKDNELVADNLKIYDGTIRYSIDRSQFPDLSLDNLQIVITDRLHREIFKKDLPFKFGTLNVDKLVLPKLSMMEMVQPFQKKTKSVITDKWIVKGILKDKDTGEGIQNYKISFYDKDLKYDDPLGKIMTKTNGSFYHEYDLAAFDDEFYATGPDLYFKVENTG